MWILAISLLVAEAGTVRETPLNEVTGFTTEAHCRGAADSFTAAANLLGRDPARRAFVLCRLGPTAEGAVPASHGNT